MKRFKHPLTLLFLLFVALALTATEVHGRSVQGRSRDGKQRDLFDQLLHSLQTSYKHVGGGAEREMQWSVHPLPRKRQNVNAAQPLALTPLSGDDGEDPAPVLGGLGNAGNAIPASILAAAASATPSAASSAASTGTSVASGSSVATASASSVPASTTAAPSATSASASSASVTPLSRLISGLPTPSSTSTITAPTTTSISQQFPSPSSTGGPSLLSPKNKFFPLTIAGLACAGLLSLMLLIAIARTIAHSQLRRENLRKSYSFPEAPPSSKDRFTTGGPPMSAARSLRRALTKKKLGSFARRTQDGSVLIEVGDEVFSVPPHLADSYRERILREKKRGSDISDGPFGKVKPRHLTDGGPDGDEEKARAAYDEMLEGGDGTGVRRSLSQRLTDRLRSLTTAAPPVVPGRVEAYSFNSRNQETGAMRQSNLAKGGVITHGGAGWEIQQRVASSSAPPPPPVALGTAKVTDRTKALQRKPAPKLELSLLTEKLQDLEKQSSSSSSSSSGKGTFGGSDHSSTQPPGAFPVPERTKSLHHSRARSVKPLILNMEEPQRTANVGVGGYRHKQPSASRSKTQREHKKAGGLNRKSTVIGSSVGLASPTRFAHERAARAVVHPEKPPQAAFMGTVRPLPVPPPFTLPK